MKILVTGGAGFIGSAVVREAIRAGHDVLTIDKLTYAGRRESLAEVLGSPRHRFVRADIANRAAMTQAFAELSPDAVLNLAAESHVDRSIDAPDAFVTSPYAASKAAGDHFARAWQRTYGLPVIITNCSNNYGPWQHGEKLVPTVIRCALAGAPIPIYGAGANGRDWLHVSDHVAGLFAALHRGRAGGSYLFGSGRSTRNLELATMICALLDARRRRPDGKPYAAQITFVADRPGHDFRYAVDPSHAEQELGWRSTEGLETGLAKTIEWYLDNPAWLAPQGLGRLGTLRARGPEQHGG